MNELAVDAYANEYDLTAEAARTEIRAQKGLADRIELARSAAGAQFAGVWVEHDPFAIVVSTVGDANEQTKRAFLDLEDAVEFRGDAVVNEADAVVLFEEMRAEIDILYPGSGSSFSPATGVRFLIDEGDHDFGPQRSEDASDQVLPANQFAESVLAGLRESDLEVSFVVGDFGDGAQHTRAGRRIDLDPAGDCTSGFTVKQWVGFLGIWVRGVSTAGHCDNGVGQYIQNANLNYDVTFVSQKTTLRNDVEWRLQDHAHDPQPKVLVGTSSWADVFATRSRGNQWVGMFTCHAGITTGFGQDHCGTVTSTAFAPPNHAQSCNQPNQTCLPKWVSVDSVDCWWGDSGGPWWSYDLGGPVNHTNLYATGIHSGRVWEIGHPQQHECYYIATDSLEAGLNVEILTASSP